MSSPVKEQNCTTVKLSNVSCKYAVHKKPNHGQTKCRCNTVVSRCGAESPVITPSRSHVSLQSLPHASLFLPHFEFEPFRQAQISAVDVRCLPVTANAPETAPAKCGCVFTLYLNKKALFLLSYTHLYPALLESGHQYKHLQGDKDANKALHSTLIMSVMD